MGVRSWYDYLSLVSSLHGKLVQAPDGRLVKFTKDYIYYNVDSRGTDGWDSLVIPVETIHHVGGDCATITWSAYDYSDRIYKFFDWLFPKLGISTCIVQVKECQAKDWRKRGYKTIHKKYSSRLPEGSTLTIRTMLKQYPDSEVVRGYFCGLSKAGIPTVPIQS